MTEQLVNSLKKLRDVLASEDISGKPKNTADAFQKCILCIDNMNRCVAAGNVDDFVITKVGSVLDGDLLGILFRDDPTKKLLVSVLYQNFSEQSSSWIISKFH